MDCVDYTIVGEAPEFVSPLLGIAVGVLRMVVVDEVRIANVLVEGRVKGGVGEKVRKSITWRHVVQDWRRNFERVNSESGHVFQWSLKRDRAYIYYGWFPELSDAMTCN